MRYILIGFPQKLLDEIDEAKKKDPKYNYEKPSRNRWVRDAVIEKIEKLKREGLI